MIISVHICLMYLIFWKTLIGDVMDKLAIVLALVYSLCLCFLFWPMIKRWVSCVIFTTNYTKSIFYIVKGTDLLHIKYECVTGYVETPLFLHIFLYLSIYLYICFFADYLSFIFIHLINKCIPIMSYLTSMLTGIFVIHNHLIEIGFMMSGIF